MKRLKEAAVFSISMSKFIPPERRNRLHFVLTDWFEEQVRNGTLRAGDQLPPERKLGEQFGISRTAVREALRALAARGLIESQVGRGTFVRLPDVGHLVEKMGLIHDTTNGQAAEALRCVVAGLARLAAQRRSEELLEKLQHRAEEIDERLDAFLHCLGDAAENPLMGAIARALAHLAAAQGLVFSQQMDVARIVTHITDQKHDEAWQQVMTGQDR